MISMTSIWDDTVAFIKREVALLIPLTLATVVMAQTAITLASGGAKGAATNPNPVVALALLVAISVMVCGQLATSAMVLKNGISIAEALRLGASRLPKFLGFGLILLLGAFVVFMPMVMILAVSGYDLAGGQMQLPPVALLYVLIMIAGFMWLNIRLMMVTPLIVDRNLPLRSVFATSFAATKGHVPKIIGAFVLYIIVALVISSVANVLFGSVFLVIGKALGLPDVGRVFAALANGVVSGALSMVSTVYIAMLYLKLVPGSRAG